MSFKHNLRYILKDMEALNTNYQKHPSDVVLMCIVVIGTILDLLSGGSLLTNLVFVLGILAMQVTFILIMKSTHGRWIHERDEDDGDDDNSGKPQFVWSAV